MRRTIITLDTKEGKYIPVFVVTEELCPDMQDYNFTSFSKHSKTHDKHKNNLSITIEDFSEDDPFKLNGNCGRSGRHGRKRLSGKADAS